ncbi:hypothetical protein [Dyella choica]|uniref:Uncharacterized protein n=1 Tax=Dyella choica TaxID=1927959 RepID=A0A432M5U9_9GAMM|nr:hypothetical protein [Dyella choica]RUL74561.1 hypothetical protein EKH80_13870 [Dyella choica]
MGLATVSVHAADYPWTLAIYGEGSVPAGWVQVRENSVQGSKLDLDRNLHVHTMQTIRLLAWRPLSDVGEMHFGVSTSQLNGHAMTAVPVYYNGTTIAPGRLNTITGFQNFIAFDASYWHRLFDVGHGGRLWWSVGATYVMLNFKLNGTIAAHSAGHELREDFYVQELPVPVAGLHLRYPLTDELTFTADVSAGRLPWVNSLRTEGGEIRLAQSNDEALLGFEYRFAEHWQAMLYGFHRYFGQNERSREDGNVIRLRSNGVGFGLNYTF